MDEKPYRVTVVVDARYGKRLRDLPAGEPVWVVDSAGNRREIEAIWRVGKADHLSGLTSFKVDEQATPEDWLVSQLDDVDLHHGEYSHRPPWSVLNAVGARWSERIAGELKRLGFTEHSETATGFEAARSRA